jgi:hypothetical protein
MPCGLTQQPGKSLLWFSRFSTEYIEKVHQIYLLATNSYAKLPLDGIQIKILQPIFYGFRVMRYIGLVIIDLIWKQFAMG